MSDKNWNKETQQKITHDTQAFSLMQSPPWPPRPIAFVEKSVCDFWQVFFHNISAENSCFFLLNVH